MVKISIIMPVWNEEKYLSKAIDSVLNQTFNDWELIIVNDASTDKTEKIAEKYTKEDKRITLINHKKNEYKSSALNNGIKYSKGEYICYLDGDDMYLKNKLKFQVDYMEKYPEIDMLYGRAKIIGGTKSKTSFLDSSIDLKQILKDSQKKPLSGFNAVYTILREEGKLPTGFIASCSVIIKRKIFDKCKFDENLKAIQDYDLWFQIIGKGFKIKGLDKCFYIYRAHENQISKDKKKIQESEAYIFKKLKAGKYFSKVNLKNKNTLNSIW